MDEVIGMRESCHSCNPHLGLLGVFINMIKNERKNEKKEITYTECHKMLNCRGVQASDH